MRTRIRQLTIAQSEEHLRHLSRLSAMGIAVGSNRDLLPRSAQPGQFRLQQGEVDLATIFALPGNGFIFVAPARLVVLSSGLMITDFEMAAPWDELPLELEDPEHFTFYNDVVAGLYPLPPTILNPWLTGARPFSRHLREGLIVARGQRSVPSECRDHALLQLQLLLWDAFHNEYCFTLRGHVTRALKAKYERRAQRARVVGSVREPLFQREPDGSVRLGPRGKAPLRLPYKSDRFDYDSVLASSPAPDWSHMMSQILDSSQKETP
jgi:hypothetical protein